MAPATSTSSGSMTPLDTFWYLLYLYDVSLSMSAQDGPGGPGGPTGPGAGAPPVRPPMMPPNMSESWAEFIEREEKWILGYFMHIRESFINHIWRYVERLRYIDIFKMQLSKAQSALERGEKGTEIAHSTLLVLAGVHGNAWVYSVPFHERSTWWSSPGQATPTWNGLESQRQLGKSRHQEMPITVCAITDKDLVWSIGKLLVWF